MIKRVSLLTIHSPISLAFGSTLILLALSFIFGCTPADIPTKSEGVHAVKGGKCALGQTCSNGEDDSLLSDESAPPPTVEIRHLIEPNLSTESNYSTWISKTPGGGSYIRKLTLPKNFAGRLYLAGINVGSLSSNHVKVRFKFGVQHDPITLPATVARAPGITPQSDISVLVMDLRSEPFRNVRLPYDLFDYHEYSLNSDGTFSEDDPPTQNNRNTNLFCRGLKVEDDPTFNGTGACDSAQEECLYTYAKVMDQGLVRKSGTSLIPLSPSFPQISSAGGIGYYLDSMSQKLLRPLPDKNFPILKFSETGPNSLDIIFDQTNIWKPVTILGLEYLYRGPYRLVNRSQWQFNLPLNEIHGPKRLFRMDSFLDYPVSNGALPDDLASPPQQNRIYFNSYLFPLATQLDLVANTSYLASGNLEEQKLSVNGKTQWMDGSNARVRSRNQESEHIGSCNITAQIEIIARDKNSIEYVVAKSNNVKLQLVRPTQYNTDPENEVLYSNFKTCSNNYGCSADECCINNRCWDQSLVSQCPDNSTSEGHKQIGQTCSTDLQCTSLCCNSLLGQCAPHDTNSSSPMLCEKAVGEFCIAREFCQKSTVTKCYIIKTGTDPLGATTCRQQCYQIEELGDCKNGVCVPPIQPQIPSFDPNRPNACANAIPAPNF